MRSGEAFGADTEVVGGVGELGGGASSIEAILLLLLKNLNEKKRLHFAPPPCKQIHVPNKIPSVIYLLLTGTFCYCPPFSSASFRQAERCCLKVCRRTHEGIEKKEGEYNVKYLCLGCNYTWCHHFPQHCPHIFSLQHHSIPPWQLYLCWHRQQWQ